MRRTLSLFAFALLLAAFTTACGDEQTPTSPTQPAPTVTETFSGSINPNGAATHQFTAAAPGSVSATLTSVSVAADVAVGFSIGVWTGTSCNIIFANDRAVQGAIVAGTVTTIAQLCARIYDVGNLTENMTYEFSVTHP